ncbi:MAG: sensor histidine kinase [Oscillochloris sp.]|nr:sensor histidine kinase [Oscillochloris sp.]
MPAADPTDRPDIVAALRRLRWPLAAVIGLIFALTRLAEISLVGAAPSGTFLRTIEPILWGLLAALAIWSVLSWAARQEHLRRTAETAMLADLRRANRRLEQLYELNQRIASSATLDDVLDYAIDLPARLINAGAAALVLGDTQADPLTARSVGLNDDALQNTRMAFGLAGLTTAPDQPELRLPRSPVTRFGACVVLPLIERHALAHGWIEAYLQQPLDREAWDELQPLLITVGGEVAEAITGSRRRLRELATIAELEQAITAERTRIARDLHDGVAQSLAFMRMRVDLWEDWIEQDPARLGEEFVNLKANLRTQIEELRRAIFELRPLEVGQLGFVGALRRFVHEFADQQQWEVDLNLSDLPPDLPHVLELAAFRFVQEALNNAAKHARTGHVSVALQVVDRGLQIIVADKGVGFDPGAIEQSATRHLGLRQMRERAAALDGQLTILSRPGAGTEVRVWLPIRS